jgi:hypothetical protein
MAGNEFQAGPPDPKGRPGPPPRGRPRPYYDDDDDEDEVAEAYDDPVQTLVPYKNPRALLAYYSGVFSLVPVFGIVLALVAMILGVLGYRYGRVHPTAKGTGHAVAGIVFAILGLLLNAVLFGLAWTYINSTGPTFRQQ